MTAMREDVKNFAKRTRATVIAGRIAAERGRDVRRLLGRRDGPMGATHRDLDLDVSLDYVDEVFEDYRTYAGLDTAALSGKTVMELGPGDSFGVAMRFIAAGAERVITADRFIPFRNAAQQRAIYKGVLRRLGSDEQARVEGVMDSDGAPVAGGPIDVREGLAIEQAPEQVGRESVDIIVSRAVLEHVFDIDAAFDAMHTLLKPGGLMAHKVDLRDHGLFTDGGQHALTFLTIPDRTYRWMGEETAGLPNRVLMGWYREKLEGLGYEASFLTTHLAGIDAEVKPHPHVEDGLPDQAPLGSVDQIRKRLLPRFREMPTDELLTAGFFVIARKR
jgi:SAM-dependent methyltransferase